MGCDIRFGELAVTASDPPMRQFAAIRQLTDGADVQAETLGGLAGAEIPGHRFAIGWSEEGLKVCAYEPAEEEDGRARAKGHGGELVGSATPGRGFL